MLEKLSRKCYQGRWIVLAVWSVVFVGLNFALGAVGSIYRNDFKIPGAESQEAIDLLKEKFPERAGDTVTIVFRSEAGAMDPRVREKMEQVFAEFARVDHVVAVDSPYVPEPHNISPDGKIAFATAIFDSPTQEIVRVGPELREMAENANGDGVQVEIAGGVIQFSEPPETGTAELIGLTAAIFILLVAFGSVIAMGLPLFTAIFGLGVGLALVGLFSHLMSVPNFAPQLATMIGIGVGIDYALLIVTRYRESLHRGDDPESAVVTAVVTAGRAVIFAGITVVISMLGMFVMGFAFINGMAIATSMTVLVTMVASITLLPALLGFAGKSVDKFRLPGIRRDESAIKDSYSYKWSRMVQKRPWTFAIASTIFLVILAIPMFKIDLGTADQGNEPTSKTTRRAYDLLTEGFGPGFNGPLLLAAEIDGPAGLETMNALAMRLRETPGIVAVTPPQPSESMGAAVMTLIPATSPQDHATKDLIAKLRTETVPELTSGSGARVLVGGLTAGFVDIGQVLSERLPYFIAAVIGLSFLLLMVVFRSILVPVKAAIMNLLSIGAAYGLVVAVFQWGWMKDLFGIDKTGPIESFLPMMLFAILFGLSMDYEVFLLSRVREEYDKSGDSKESVADGLAATARVITAAAAIMVTVFLAFAFGDQRVVKLFGLGLAAAIFIDATVVRMIVVPSTMELLGDANWWLPKWLDRILPEINIEGPATGSTSREKSKADSGRKSGEESSADGSDAERMIKGLAEADVSEVDAVENDVVEAEKS